MFPHLVEEIISSKGKAVKRLMYQEPKRKIAIPAMGETLPFISLTKTGGTNPDPLRNKDRSVVTGEN